MRSQIIALAIAALLTGAWVAVATAKGDRDDPAVPSSGTATTHSESWARLGERLFFDKTLSRTGEVSCGSCHRPELAFTDGMPRSRGVDGREGTRNAPSLIGVVRERRLFWDGRGAELKRVVLEPFTNEVEHGLPSLEAMIAVVSANVSYAERFQALTDRREVEAGDVGHALTSYIASLGMRPSAVDRYLEDGSQGTLSAAAYRGLTLFTGEAGCSKCHRPNGDPVGLPDSAFHRTGVGLDQAAKDLPTLLQKLLQTPGQQVGALVLSNLGVSHLGRFVVTRRPEDIGVFRTPSLRNVAQTAPYMHDGSVGTLEEAIDQELYYRSLSEGRAVFLSPSQKSDLVAFLKALSSPNNLVQR
jgi:cytochrome c peroxidase